MGQKGLWVEVRGNRKAVRGCGEFGVLLIRTDGQQQSSGGSHMLG